MDDAPEQYSRAADDTLDDAQKTLGFAKRNKFRAAGKHESAITTDTWAFLNTARPARTKGKVLLSALNPKSYFADDRVAGTEIDERIVSVLKDVADGFRTDTRRTILSSKVGSYAGHPGSKLSQDGKPSAHNFLRESVVTMLLADGPAMTEAVAVTFGAITVASMAPAKLARATLDTTGLADQEARATWEENRNEAKARVQRAYSLLTTDAERDFVVEHAKRYLAMTQDGLAFKPREFANGLPFTPRRQVNPDPQRPDDIAGGDYDLNLSPWQRPTHDPPSEASEYGYYFTAPFRAPRPPATLKH